MPSFLSKVFGRSKKEGEREKDPSSKRHSGTTSLLEGKFEAIPSNVSPSPTQSESPSRGKDKEGTKDKERDGFSLFRPRSRNTSPKLESQKQTNSTPHLTLNLPVPKEEKSRTLGVVFEADPNDRGVLSDVLIGERRLNPLETLLLVKACATAIVHRGGLSALGVMHPHWYSASPDVQHKLISLYILSLASKSPITTLSPTPTSPSLLFESELEYTRSPQDLAAVLRWALRHLRLDGDSFGTTGNEWAWYREFAKTERASSFPDDAFTSCIVPHVPPAHLQLLTATLDIISSLAAFSESNGISGSKLSKFLGLWLLTAQRTQEGDDWSTFYARWEYAARAMEHLFLAYVREEAACNKMPPRLIELIKNYPYTTGERSSGDDEYLLPRPRISTRRYDALFVRVDTRFPDMSFTKQKQHPLRLISEALKAEAASTSGEYDNIWEQIKKATESKGDQSPTGYPDLSSVFEEDTLRLLSMVPAERTEKSAPTVSLGQPPRRRRSTSLGPALGNGNGKAANGNGKAGATGGSASPTSTTPATPKDWADFSSAGFGESALGKDFAATLLDNDVEVTTPPSDVSRKSSKKRKASPSRSRRSSVDNPAPLSKPSAEKLTSLKAKTTSINVLQLDEAFIDFWSDALLDPIAANWPAFVVCQLKPLDGVAVGGKPIAWLVIEQTFSYPPPPPIPAAVQARAASPRPSISSATRKSSTFSAARKRFSIFSTSGSSTVSGSDAKSTSRKKGVAKSPRIGEMGEILSEESEGSPVLPVPSSPSSEQHKGLGITVLDVGLGAAAVAGSVAVAAKEVVVSPIPAVAEQPAQIPSETPVVAEPVSTSEASQEKSATAPQEDVAVLDEAKATTNAEIVEPTTASSSVPEPVPATHIEEKKEAAVPPAEDEPAPTVPAKEAPASVAEATEPSLPPPPHVDAPVDEAKVEEQSSIPEPQGEQAPVLPSDNEVPTSEPVAASESPEVLKITAPAETAADEQAQETEKPGEVPAPNGEPHVSEPEEQVVEAVEEPVTESITEDRGPEVVPEQSEQEPEGTAAGSSEAGSPDANSADPVPQPDEPTSGPIPEVVGSLPQETTEEAPVPSNDTKEPPSSTGAPSEPAQ